MGRLLALKQVEVDSVATVLGNIKKHDRVTILDESNQELGVIVALHDVLDGNKIAVVDIPSGGNIVKTGYEIGIAQRDILAGDLVHVHNVRSSRLDIPDNIIQSIIIQMGIEVN